MGEKSRIDGRHNHHGPRVKYALWPTMRLTESNDTGHAQKQGIEDEANRKRSEAAKEQHEVSRPYAGEKKPEMVVEQSVPPPPEKPHKERKAKAAASKTNPGAVARGDKLVKDRPDLAEKVRKGEIKPATAHRQMKKDEVSENVKDLPDGKYRVIYADPPWKYKDAQAVKGDYGTGTGAMEGHYPPMTLTELKALDIPSMAIDNSVLFLWSTCPLLEDALELCKARG